MEWDTMSQEDVNKFYKHLEKIREMLNNEKLTRYPRRIDKLMFDEVRRRIGLGKIADFNHPSGYGLGMHIVVDDHLCPKDEEPNKKPKHKPFYKERDGKRLKNWEK